MNLDCYWPDLDVGQPYRKQEGPFKCSPRLVEIHPASPLMDTLMTVGAFCLWMAAPTIVALFWALS